MLFSSETSISLGACNDQEVWDQLRKGNHLALEYLYRTYSKDLFHYGMHLYGRKGWVQDILQELFVDLWKQHQQLSSITAVKTYLFKAFKYKLQRHYGKEKRWIYQVDYESIGSMEVEASVESNMITAQLSREQQQKLVKALEKLPTRQREVLHLLFEEDLSYEEVAEIMEINVRSTYTLAWKAISSLRKLLVDYLFLLASTFFFFS